MIKCSYEIVLMCRRISLHCGHIPEDQLFHGEVKMHANIHTMVPAKAEIEL